MKDLILVSVLNWEKYNDRNDRANYHWFKFANRFFSDPKIFGLSQLDKLLFIYILCECSKIGGLSVEISISQAASVLRSSQDEIAKGLDTLKNVAVITPSKRRGLPSLRRLEERRGEKKREEEKRGEERNLAPSVSSKPLEAVVLEEFQPIAETIRNRKVSEENQRAWLVAFPEPAWIISEVRKALAWESANPSRKKQRFGAFMTNWMTRGWDSRQNLAPKSRNFAQERSDHNQAALESYLQSIRELEAN